MINDQSLPDAWHLLIAGDVAVIAGVAGRVMPAGDKATIELADGTALIVNRAAPINGELRCDPFDAPLSDWAVQYEEDGKLVADGRLTRPTTFTGISLFIAAFVASVGGAIGGRLRDLHP